MNIGSLYTCIPNDAGLQDVRHLLTDMESTPIPKEFLIERLDFVLTNNYFTFEGTKYAQIRGTAMGSSAAPSFANLFVSLLGERYIYPFDAFTNHIKCWFRYINDIFLIWTDKDAQFFDFVDFLNSIFTGFFYIFFLLFSFSIFIFVFIFVLFNFI